MPREIETYKTVMVDLLFVNTPPDFYINRYSTDIYVEFTPDEIVLKHIAVKNDTDVADVDLGMYKIRSSLVGNNYIISFPANSSYAEAVDIPFKNSNPISSVYDFNLIGTATNSPSNDVILTATLTFLFIKFKSV